ncbi:MAG: Ig-like domain-containing protein [Chloroflexaceae bacterium]|nr:Ig-like domain-containing protein [Chloroflexaceae bacterium]
MYRRRFIRAHRAIAVALMFLLLLSLAAVGGYARNQRQAFNDSPVPSVTPTLVDTPPQTQQRQDQVIFLPLVARPAAREEVPGPGPAAPVIIQQSPAMGEELPPDGTIELIFDRAMDQDSVAAALKVYAQPTETGDGITTAQQTPIDGQISWSDERTVQFQPDGALPRASTYRLLLDDQARAADGQTLGSIYDMDLITSGYLHISQVIPAPESRDIARDTVITVIFDRPVVPLRVVEDQTNLPHPLSFEPALTGSGMWVNTSIYTFQPDQRLAANTTYTVQVDPNLQDVQGNPLQPGIDGDANATSWSFTTLLPPEVTVEGVVPTADATLVELTPRIEVALNQPVDHHSAVASFQLQTANGQPVDGSIAVRDTHLFSHPRRNWHLTSSIKSSLRPG